MKEFIRNFKKQQTVGVLNISSLSLGIMVAIVIGLWAINEMSFDRFHKNRDRIYRTIMCVTINDAPAKSPQTYSPVGYIAKDEMPEIEDMCRIIIRNEVEIRIDNILYQSVAAYLTDSNFFNFFTFPLVTGDPNQVLSAPDRVVISESAAKRYFSEKDPIGRIIKYNERDFAVSGIMKDMPKNSSLQTDFVFPFFGYSAAIEWSTDSYSTFFLLHEGVSAKSLEEQLTQIIHHKFEPFKTSGITFNFESLNDMHFSAELIFERIIKGNKSLVMIFIIIALLILIVSCINFTNLFVSTSFIRAKTIGIKKALGAKRLRLIRDFYMETACYVLVAIYFGFALTSVTIPVFNNFTQSNLIVDFGSLQLYLFLAALFVFVTLIAGTFPALYLTRFNPRETLKGKFKGKKMSLLQKSLVVAQFAASIALLIVVAFMQKQVNYILKYDLGFNMKSVIYVQAYENFKKNYKTLENEFFMESTITEITAKNSLPTIWGTGIPLARIPSDSITIFMEACYVSPNYFDFFDMKIIDGENPFFSESSEPADVVINESAARMLGYEQPVGEFIGRPIGDFKNNIKGVVRNAYTKSLHQEVDPQMYIKLSDNDTRWNVLFFKISGDPQRAITFIEQIWKEREPEYPFEYHFLDDTYKRLYTSEMNAGKVFIFAMAITIIITVAGLYAMAYYATQRRMREVAIRKVYGASAKEIFMLLNKDFLLLVAIAFAIACPIAYYGLQKWLESFVIKTPLSAWVFVLVGVVAFLITLLTIGYQTWKVATANPVKYLKAE